MNRYWDLIVDPIMFFPEGSQFSGNPFKEELFPIAGTFLNSRVSQRSLRTCEEKKED